VAWLIYDLEFLPDQNQYQLAIRQKVYTQFRPALQKITTPEPGSLDDFIADLQTKLDEKLENQHPPDAPTLADIVNQ
jgi:hypothetical protein